MKSLLAFVGLLALGATSLVSSTEYHVRPTGNDQADGKTASTAFRTIQKGVSALDAGDTLIIGPGQYFESVSRENLGNAEVDTVIKAEIPGTVLLHGDAPVSQFTKVDGYRFIYVADFPEKPYAVAEVDTLRLVETALYLEELEFVPGSYFYDEANKKLYLSSSDLQPATDHYYRASLVPKNGLLLKSPVRVVIDGIAATGFNFNETLPTTDGFGTRWGILLENPSYCSIRNCIAYLNGGGIALHGEKGSGHNVIEDCRAYGNNSKFASEIGNIAVYHGFGDTLRRNYVYLGGSKGQWFYISNKGKLHMEDCVGWGNASGDFWIKGMRETAEDSTAKRIVSMNYTPAPHHRDSLIGKSPAPEDAEANNSIYLTDETEVDWNSEFADPVHLDFRLQSTSRFRKSGNEGRDRGPLPFTGTVYYVRPDGNDQADGQSLETAWKSLSHATAKLQPGETLYVEGGRYSCSVSNLPDQVTILGRGIAPVVLEGNWKLSKVNDLSLKRLHFQKELTIDQSQGVSLDNCTFLNGSTCIITSCDRVRLLHSIFTETLDLQKSRNIFIAGTIFGQSPGLTVSNLRDIIYSDYNSYTKADSAWLVAGKTYDLTDLKPLQQETQSIVVVPEFSVTQEPLILANSGLFSGRGPWGTDIGLYFEGRPRPLRVAGPFVHSTTNTTANLEWWTSAPAVVEIAWGKTPDCPNKKTLHFSSFGAYSLTGLTPGTQYFFKMRIVGTTPQYPLKDWLKVDSSSVLQTVFTTTHAEEKPRELYVRPDGDNTRDGLSPNTAWKTLNYAANQVRPGDTVWMGGGEYHETLWLRVTGERNQPISFRGIPGQRATVDGKFRQLFAAVVSNGKHFQNFDAIYGVNLGEIGGVNGKSLAIERGGMFILSFSDHANVTRTLMDGRGPRYSPTLIVADSCDHLRVKNSVSINGYNGPYFYNSPNLRVENCVIFRSLICQFLLINHSDQPALVANNIFTDGLPVKIKAPIIALGRPRGLLLQNNCFFPREPSAEKTLVNIYDDKSFEAERAISLMGPNRDQGVVQAEMARLTLEQLDSFFASSQSFIANPEFAGLQNLPAKDNKGNPTYPPDRLDMKPVDFQTFFSTNPELIKRGVGLIPSDFHDFNYANDPTPSVNP